MSDAGKKMPVDREPQSLEKIVSHLLEECRMVLPGIQAIFGFQLIAVFNTGFSRDLSPAEQVTHLVSVSLMVLAMAAVLTPAAYHRIAETHSISDTFVKLASFLLSLGMFFLMNSLAIDLFLITHVISHSLLAAGLVCGAAELILGGAWFAFPFFCRR